MIHIEPKILVIRGGKDFRNYGDHFDFVVSVYIEGDIARIFGLCGKFTYNDFINIKKQLTSIYEIKTISWERKKKNRTKNVLWKDKENGT